MAKNSNYYLLKLNRILVWILLPLMAVFIISGYGITNPKLVSAITGGILSISRSLYVHRILAVPLLVLLMIHILIELRFTLTRWGIQNGRLLNFSLVIIGVSLTILLVVMETVRP